MIVRNDYLPNSHFLKTFQVEAPKTVLTCRWEVLEHTMNLKYQQI